MEGDQLIPNPNVATYGPVTQKQLLTEIGIDMRMAKLLAILNNDARAQQLIESFDRLTADDMMGTIYKALAITSKDMEAPPGFYCLDE